MKTVKYFPHKFLRIIWSSHRWFSDHQKHRTSHMPFGIFILVMLDAGRRISQWQAHMIGCTHIDLFALLPPFNLFYLLNWCCIVTVTPSSALNELHGHVMQPRAGRSFYMLLLLSALLCYRTGQLPRWLIGFVITSFFQSIILCRWQCQWWWERRWRWQQSMKRSEVRFGVVRCCTARTATSNIRNIYSNSRWSIKSKINCYWKNYFASSYHRHIHITSSHILVQS